MKLANMTAIVTGAGSGMGEATARLLAANGVKVALFDLNEVAVNQVAKEIGGIAFVCDVSDDEAVTSAVMQAEAQHGPARICVHCAGVAPAKRMVGRKGVMPLADFEQVIKINLVGSFNIMRVVASRLVETETVNESGERGVVILTSSVAATEGQIGQTAYSASKGGVIGMTLPAARELASQGIRVMTIAPGIVATPMLLNMPQTVQDSLAASVPFPKRLADPKEYAELAKHIVENEMLNGSVIRLDGAIRMAPK